MTPATSVSAERLCQAGVRCRNFDHPRKRAALLDLNSPPLCPDCLRVAERDVRNLPADYVALEQLIPPSLGEWSDGQPKRGRGELPLPLREYVLVLQRHIWWVATSWEPVVRDMDRLSAEVRIGVREGWAVRRAVDVIAPRLDRLARLGPCDMADYPALDDSMESAVVWGPDRQHPDQQTAAQRHHAIDHTAPTGADGILHLTRLHSLANAMTGLTERVRRLPGTCHECDGEDLRQRHPRQFKDDPPVWCHDCGAWRPYDEYERMMRLLVWQGAA
jgi:hypothetical protein